MFLRFRSPLLPRPRPASKIVSFLLDPGAGYVDELEISIAPLILGGGKRLFNGSELTLDQEQTGLLQSAVAMHITYRLVR